MAIITFFIARRNKTSNLVLATSLACADLFLSITVVPFDIIYWLDFPTWTLGPQICKLWNSLFFLLLTSISLHITVIGVDIYIAILKPLRYTKFVQNSRVTIAMLLIWLYSFGIGIATYLLQDNPPSRQYGFIINSTVYGSFLSFHIMTPLLSVPWLYFRVFAVACEQKNRILNMEKSVANHNIIPINKNQIAPDSIRKMRQQSVPATEKIRFASVFMTVSLIYILCWTPFLIVQFMIILDSNVNKCNLEIADTVVCWIAYFQSCLDPLVYTFRYKRFRRMFLNIFRKNANSAVEDDK